MADLDVSVIASSAKKHKRGLKTMKKKNPLIDLNTSVRRKRLNSSLTKKLNLSSKFPNRGVSLIFFNLMIYRFC